MKEIKRIRNKELKYLRDSNLWGAGFYFTFGCAPILVSDYVVAYFSLSFLFFSLWYIVIFDNKCETKGNKN